MARSVTSNYTVKAAVKATVKKANNSSKDAGGQLGKTVSGFKSQNGPRNPKGPNPENVGG